MAEIQPAFTSSDMGKRAQEITHLFTLAMHAELAETLLTGKAPAKDPEAKEAGPSYGAVLLRHTKKASLRQRRKMARNLVLRDPVTGQLRPIAEQQFLRKIIRLKGSKTPMMARAHIVERFLEIWGLTKEDDHKIASAKLTGVVGEFLPVEIVPGSTTVVYRNLDFMVERLFCSDPTNGEPGDDEMAFTGIAVTAEEASGGLLGTAQSAPVIDAGGGFDAQVARNFSPHERLWRWDISNQPDTTVYSMTLILAETDGAGGIEDIRNDVRDAVRIQMAVFLENLAIAMIAGGYAGLLVGGIVGTAFPVIGTIVGLILGLLTGATIGAMVAVFIHLGRNYDDIFDPALYAIQLDPASLSGPPFNGNTRTPSSTTRIHGDGGVYEITTYWQLS